MNLTPEQMEQCRKEFEKWRGENMADYLAEFAWGAFQAAWRPIPSVEEIGRVYAAATGNNNNGKLAGFMAIHRAFGGK